MCAAMETGPRVGGEKAASQSFSEREIQGRERLEPRALQGGLLTTLGPTEAQVGFLGQREGGGTRGGPVLGGGFGRGLGTCAGEPPSFQVKGNALPGAPLPGQHSTQNKDWADGLWTLGGRSVAQWEEGKRAWHLFPEEGQTGEFRESMSVLVRELRLQGRE